MTKKTVLVTGASRGIGKAIALRFARGGYDVIINASKSINDLLSVKEEAESFGVKCLPVLADVSTYEAVKHMFEEIALVFPSIDCVINNAGKSHIGLFTETTPEIWNDIIQSNLTSAYNICYCALPRMIQEKSGVIINISSIWGIRGASTEVAYSASKSGLNGLTKALSKELGPSNIRVNAIACGAIETSMNSWLTPEEKSDFTQSIALCRFGKVNEVADLAFYLASSEASYLTGEIIKLDGGI